jgi:hypothetical protein
MKREGFNNLKRSSLGWTRKAANGHLFLWFQCDKWGWTDNWGSTFTLEFQLAPKPTDAMTMLGRRERIGHLLEGFEELDELRIRNNLVIERLPGALDGRWLTKAMEDGTQIVVEGYKIDPDKAIYGRDVWMNYYTLEDVRNWASYFERKLSRFISLFENEIRSEEGKANIRFHQMMGRVQNARELQDKASILEEFIRTEQDSHYRSGAIRWLDQIKKIKAGTPRPAGSGRG